MLIVKFKILFVGKRVHKGKEKSKTVEYVINDDTLMIDAFNTVKSDYYNLNIINISIESINHV